MGIQDLFSVLTGQQYDPQATLAQTPAVNATAPIAAPQQPQFANMIGTPAVAPASTGWLDDPAKKEQLSAIFSAMAGAQNGRSGTEQLGAALTAGNQVKQSRIAQDKKEARDATLETQHDAQAAVTLDASRYNLEAAKAKDPVALKAAEQQYKNAQTDGERKQAEFELFQQYGAKEYEAKLAKLRAEADKAVTDAGKAKTDLKGELAPWGTEEHMAATRRNAAIIKSFSPLVTDPVTGFQVPGTFNETAFRNWYDSEQGQYPKAADVKAGTAKAGRIPPPAPAGATLADFVVMARQRGSAAPEAEAAKAFAKYQAKQKQ